MRQKSLQPFRMSVYLLDSGPQLLELRSALLSPAAPGCSSLHPLPFRLVGPGPPLPKEPVLALLAVGTEATTATLRLLESSP